MKNNPQNAGFLYFLNFIFVLRERGSEGESEGEKHWCGREHWGVARHMSQPGTEPVTFWFAWWYLPNWVTSAECKGWLSTQRKQFWLSKVCPLFHDVRNLVRVFHLKHLLFSEKYYRPMGSRGHERTRSWATIFMLHSFLQIQWLQGG